MQIRLRTRAEVDGATFWFGTADAELLLACDVLNAAWPLILSEALREETGESAEEILKKLNDMTVEEIAERAKDIEIGERHLTGDVKRIFCELFTAAVVEWEGVTDDEGAEVQCIPPGIATFPTDQKVKVTCEFFNERRRLLGEETAPGQPDTP